MVAASNVPSPVPCSRVSMHALHACVICMLYACFICMPYMHALHACLIWMRYTYALYVCLICAPCVYAYMYALHVWHMRMQRLAKRTRAHTCCVPVTRIPRALKCSRTRALTCSRSQMRTLLCSLLTWGWARHLRAHVQDMLEVRGIAHLLIAGVRLDKHERGIGFASQVLLGQEQRNTHHSTTQVRSHTRTCTRTHARTHARTSAQEIAKRQAAN